MNNLEKIISRRNFLVLGMSSAASLFAHLPPKLDSVTNASHPNNKIGACSLATVWGNQLADGQSYAAIVPLPETLDDKTYVEINGLRAKLLYSSEGQINLQVPCELIPGTYDLSVIHDGKRSEVKPVQINASGPGIFELPPLFGNNLAAAVINPNERFPNGRIVGLGNSPANVQTSPAQPSDIVLFYTTGLPMVGNLVSGSPAEQPYDISSLVEVLLDGKQISTEHLVWHPLYVGAQQGAFRIPDIKSGVHTLSLKTRDGTSMEVELPVVTIESYASGIIRTTDKKKVVFNGLIKNNERNNTFSSSNSGNYVVDIPGPRSGQLEIMLSHPDYYDLTNKVQNPSQNIFGNYSMIPVVLERDAHFVYNPNPKPINPGDPPMTLEQRYFTETNNLLDMLSLDDVLLYLTTVSNGILNRFISPPPNKINLNRAKVPIREALPYLEKAIRAWDLGKTMLVEAPSDYDPREDPNGGLIVRYEGESGFIRLSRNSKGAYIGEIFITPRYGAVLMGDVLAHEEGHWFGLPHSAYWLHIMSGTGRRPAGLPPLHFEKILLNTIQELPNQTNIRMYSKPANFNEIKQKLLQEARQPLMQSVLPRYDGTNIFCSGVVLGN